MSKILIIDDKKDNLLSIKALINTYKPDYEVMTAQSGKEGIKLAKTKKPDTILLDIIIPIMDGYEVCKKLKQDNELKYIPIIFLTAVKTSMQDMIKGLELGAEAYLTKPVEPGELIAQIEVMLRIKKAEDELQAEKELLEQKVLERTKDLVKAITKLTKSREEIKKSEELNRSITQTAADGIISINSEGIIFSWNDSAKRIFGYSSSEMIDNDLSKILPTQFRTAHNTGMKRLKSGGTEKLIGKTIELTGLRKSGEKFPIELSISSWEADNQKYYTGIIRDITKRKKFITDLMEREEKYRTLTQNLNVGVYRSTPGKNGIFIEANPAFLKMFEFRSKKELERWKVGDFFSDSLEIKNIEEKLASKGFVINEKVKLRKKDGKTFFASISSTSATDESGKVTHYDGIIEDRSEEHKTREDILAYQSNLKSLTNELLVTEEEAKRRLAMTLHDKLLQSLILANLKSSELNKIVEKSEHKKIISEISGFVDNAINESRNITYELSPPVLYEMGLIPAINWKLGEIEKNSKINTSLTDQSNSYKFEDREQIILFRTISELLLNVIKHSKANNVNVSFRLLNNDYKITVGDNGVGFDMEAMQEKAVSQKKFGLFSIMERIKYIGGEVNINTKLNKGTKVIIKLPIKQK
jgi:PAS domain S-box-containing protein